jgi:alanine racemase
VSSTPERAQAWVEVDLAAIAGNVRALKLLLGRRTGVIAVVKADAYGHGALPVSRAAVAGGAAMLAVTNLLEAAELRKSGIAAPLLVLDAGSPALAEEVVRLGLVQTVSGFEMARALSAAAKKLRRPAEVHLKIDTGLGRLGAPHERAAALLRRIACLPQVKVSGLFSHLATAEDADRSYALLQFERFRSALAALRAAGLPVPPCHLANSAGLLSFPEMRLDFVRAGLLIYGIDPGPGLPKGFRPALTWKTRIAFLKRLRRGDSVSYGRTFVAPGAMRIAVLPLGYADGYPRPLSNRGEVLIRGKRCPVVGVVCMDHTMVDVSGISRPRPGELVLLLGRQGREAITVAELAKRAGTVPHEITTRIGKRVGRVLLRHGQPAGL